jgi:hypothetical protein
MWSLYVLTQVPPDLAFPASNIFAPYRPAALLQPPSFLPPMVIGSYDLAVEAADRRSSVSEEWSHKTKTAYLGPQCRERRIVRTIQRCYITSFSWSREVSRGRCANQLQGNFSQSTSVRLFGMAACPCIPVLPPNATRTTTINQSPNRSPQPAPRLDPAQLSPGDNGPALSSRLVTMWRRPSIRSVHSFVTIRQRHPNIVEKVLHPKAVTLTYLGVGEVIRRAAYGNLHEIGDRVPRLSNVGEVMHPPSAVAR